MSTPKRKFTNAQRITMIAISAWKKLDAHGAIDEPCDDWRHRESVECVGVRISEATSAQLDRLETHFLALGGDTGKAFDQATGESGETKRMRFRIQQLADQLGLGADYAVSKKPHQLKGVLINLSKQARAAQSTQA